MTSEAPAGNPNASRHPNASSHLLLFVFGLAAGAAVTAFALRALKARQDPYPHSMMQVMEKQFALLDADIEANRCAATDGLPRLRMMRAVSSDIEIAFPDLAEDASFRKYASQLRAHLDAAIAIAPNDCEATRAARARAVEGCKACHRDFVD